MRAIAIRTPGGPEVLELVERPSPVCAPDDARIRVRATAINRADLIQRRGKYPVPPGVVADIPGLEFAGEVIELGASAGGAGLALGDRVFGLVGGGSYAEELVVDARTLARIPAELSFVEAAAIPEAFITAHDAMITQAHLAKGDTVLIHAVGSGVGTAASQIARAFGARVIGTSRTAPKLERARALGVDHGIVVAGNEFAREVLEATAGHGVDVVLDLVGGAYITENLVCTASRGRILVVGLVAGARADIDLSLLLRKRIALIGTALRSRSLDEKIAVNAAFVRDIVPRLAARELVPVIERVFPLADAAAAHGLVEGNDPFGKVVLEA